MRALAISARCTRVQETSGATALSSVAPNGAVIADRLRELGRLRAERVVFTLVAGDWFR